MDLVMSSGVSANNYQVFAFISSEEIFPLLFFLNLMFSFSLSLMLSQSEVHVMM
jgi:hypothetical protein